MGLAPVAELLSSIGQRLPQSSEPAAKSANGVPLGMSAVDAKAEIQKLQQDARFAKVYLDKRAAGHQEAVDRMSALFASAFPQPESAPAPATPAAPSGGNDAAAAARAKIEGWIGNQGFMASLGDKQHADHAANREAWDTAHREAGLR
jgi:hypothetical protein